jgi:hypothetical protein
VTDRAAYALAVLAGLAVFPAAHLFCLAVVALEGVLP